MVSPTILSLQQPRLLNHLALLGLHSLQKPTPCTRSSSTNVGTLPSCSCCQQHSLSPSSSHSPSSPPASPSFCFAQDSEQHWSRQSQRQQLSGVLGGVVWQSFSASTTGSPRRHLHRCLHHRHLHCCH